AVIRLGQDALPPLLFATLQIMADGIFRRQLFHDGEGGLCRGSPGDGGQCRQDDPGDGDLAHDASLQEKQIG
ncbi:MAG TPA: hypothetical protein VJM79_05180, partial [Rhizorhapis sp.]|nr:hypothetical protein [Rhizorhapis sp.]